MLSAMIELMPLLYRLFDEMSDKITLIPHSVNSVCQKGYSSYIPKARGIPIETALSVMLFLLNKRRFFMAKIFSPVYVLSLLFE